MMDAKERESIANWLQTSIMKLCQNAFEVFAKASDHLEVDGLLCLSLGQDQMPIIVKINHAKLSMKEVSIPIISANTSGQSLNLEVDGGASNRMESSKVNDSMLGAGVEGGSNTWFDESSKDDQEEDNDDEDEKEEESMVTYDGSSTPVLNTSIKKEVFCETCMITFSTFKELQEHHLLVHGKHTCATCWSSFDSAENLEKHNEKPCTVSDNMTCIVVKKPYRYQKKRKTCSACGITCVHLHRMARHMWLKHGLRNFFSCNLCHLHFPSKVSYIQHRKKLHSDAKDISCPVCGVGLKYQELKLHKRQCGETVSEGGEGDHGYSSTAKPCSQGQAGDPGDSIFDELFQSLPLNSQVDTAGKGSEGVKLPVVEEAAEMPNTQVKEGSTSNLKAHLAFKCEKCYEIFTVFNEYKLHLYSEHKRYVCEICYRTFRYGSSLKRHMHSHSGFRPYLCEYCHETFQRRTVMIQHQNRAHKNAKK